VTSLWTGRPGLDSRQGSIFLSATHNVQTGSGAHPASYPIGTGVPSSGVKRPEREDDHSYLSNVKVMNAWRYTCTLPIRLHGVVLSYAPGTTICIYYYYYTITGILASKRTDPNSQNQRYIHLNNHMTKNQICGRNSMLMTTLNFRANDILFFKISWWILTLLAEESEQTITNLVNNLCKTLIYRLIFMEGFLKPRY
jgi:hypothetical protein